MTYYSQNYAGILGSPLFETSVVKFDMQMTKQVLQPTITYFM